jgi:pimeloyl-ACP methyl ester carboxylesterase
VTFDTQVGLVADVLDSFEVERCLLAGDSSFAAVAVAAAHRWPERIEGLVLVGARLDHAPDERTTRFVAGLRQAFTPTVKGFVELCLPEDEHGHLQRWLTDIITRTGPERAAALVESFYGIDARPLLASLAVPVLVIHGALDRINPLHLAHEMAEQVQDAELVVIDDAGHVPTLSRPETVATAMDRFADRITHH